MGHSGMPSIYMYHRGVLLKEIGNFFMKPTHTRPHAHTI